MPFALDPAVIAYLAIAAFLYARAIRILRERGWEVPRAQQAFWWGGLALTAAALVGPVPALSDDLLMAHMGEHLLIADLAAPLLLAGLRTPVLVFFLPRPVLVRLAGMGRLRRAFRTLRRPLVAIPVWVVSLYGWHFAFAFEGALRSPWIHILQHVSFVFASMLVWWGVVEPQKARSRGELWKIGHLIGARVAGMFLGMAFILAGSQVYAGYYGARALDYGVTPMHDQQYAGGMMLGLDVLVMFFALGFFFWRAAQDHDRAEQAAAPVA